ncbi:MAG: LuxR C-terminal-related transcriptional regulator [Sphingobium sp.]
MHLNPRQMEYNGVRGMDGAANSSDFRRLLGALGTRRFYGELGNYLREICAADHFHVFLYEGQKPKILSAFSIDGSDAAEGHARDYMTRHLWREDKWLNAGSMVQSPTPLILQESLAEVTSPEVRNFYSQQHLQERVLLCGREHFGSIGISVIRIGADLFGEQAVHRLSTASDIILPLVCKHVDLCGQSQLVLEALTSLSVIEQILSRMPNPLPRRETQVCARFLFGLSASSIADDLRISQETVLSYRKRIYQRLDISSHRELLLWYLSLHADLSEDIVKPDVFSLKTVC